MRRAAGWVFDFYWGQGIADDVPALTYYLLLSIGPFALGMAALEALLLDDFLGAIAVADQINRLLPEAVHGDVRRLGRRPHHDIERESRPERGDVLAQVVLLGSIHQRGDERDYAQE